MRFLGNADLNQNLLRQAALESTINFPTAPVAGQLIFKEKRVMICIELDGGIPVWAPLTNEINTYVHDQTLAATTWVINHDLESASAIVQVLDVGNKHVIPDEVTQTFNQTVISFNEAQSGRAILMLGSAEGHPRANIAYEQEILSASTTWVITHGLGYNPILRVFIGNNEVQPLSISHDSVNQATVTFTNPQTGKVKAI